MPLFAQGQEPTLDLETCFVSGVKSQAKCGKLKVAENRAEAFSEENSIELNVVVLPRFKEESKASPMFFLAGGPGQAATELAGALNSMLSDVRQEHDIILVDQRGTGGSHALNCESDMEEEPLSANDSDINWKEEVEECLKQFSGHHLPSYSTYDAVEDFEQVRKALGHKKVHIYGGSYGTRSGFAYLKNYPESIESAILDSNAPMELVIGFFGKTGEDAFELLLQDCQLHSACAESFPNLKQDYIRLTNQLEKEPFQQQVFHPVTGKATTVYISKKKVVEVIRASLYAVPSRQILPFVINQAAQGDFRGLAALIGETNFDPNAPGKLYMGLTLNILCNEDIPRATDAEFKRDDANYFSGELGYSLFTQLCEYWPKWEAPADFADPVTADVPVLLFSGKYDPVTPPSYGEMALKSLPNAKHVVIEYGAHVASLRMCSEAINDFMKEPDFEKLDLSCATKEKPILFFTDGTILH